MTFKVTVVNKFSENVLHKGRNGAGVKAEKYVQIRFLTNACVDTMVDYFKGNIDLSLDEVGEVIIDFLNKMKK